MFLSSLSSAYESSLLGSPSYPSVPTTEKYILFSWEKGNSSHSLLYILQSCKVILYLSLSFLYELEGSENFLLNWKKETHP